MGQQCAYWSLRSLGPVHWACWGDSRRWEESDPPSGYSQWWLSATDQTRYKAFQHSNTRTCGRWWLNASEPWTVIYTAKYSYVFCIIEFLTYNIMFHIVMSSQTIYEAMDIVLALLAINPSLSREELEKKYGVPHCFNPYGILTWLLNYRNLLF